MHAVISRGYCQISENLDFLPIFVEHEIVKLAETHT